MNQEMAARLHETIMAGLKLIDDATALKGVELFTSWAPEANYSLNERIRYNNTLYKCLQSHVSQMYWTPENSPSLWTRVLIPDENQIPAWEQPNSTNPYKKGDKVFHKDKIWVSTVDNNTWEPGVYGWEEVVEAISSNPTDE